VKTFNLKKTFLYAFIVSISISALLGIVATLTGTVEQNGRILLTALTITIASFSMFLNGIFFEKMLGKILPLVGFVLTGIAAVLCISTIWDALEFRVFLTIIVLLFANFFLFPFSFYYEDRKKPLLPIVGSISTIIAALLSIRAIWSFPANEFLERLFFVSVVLAVACFYLSLIFMVTLAKKFAWSVITVQIAVWLLAAILIWLIVFEPRPNTFLSEIISRISVILAIIITAFTVMIPIFYRLNISELAPPEKITVKEIDAKILRLKSQIEWLEKQKKEIVETSTGL